MNLADLSPEQQSAFAASLQPGQATVSSFQSVADPFAVPSPKASLARDPFAVPSPKASPAAPSAVPEPAEIASIATTISKTIGDVVTSVAAAARP
jgi:hypothetical protein